MTVNQNTPAAELTSKSPKRKVVAATVGAGIGVQTSDFLNWCIGQAWFTPDTVPGPIAAFVAGVVTTVFALAGGYLVRSAPGE